MASLKGILQVTKHEFLSIKLCKVSSVFQESVLTVDVFVFRTRWPNSKEEWP